MKTRSESVLKELFLEELRTYPNLSTAADKLRIPTPRLYVWKRDDPHFWKNVLTNLEIGREWVCDRAEAQIVKRIEEGDLTAAKYWLKYNGSRYSDSKGKQDTLPLPTPILVNVRRFKS